MILTALVSTETLAQHLADPDWVVFDCRHDLTDPTRGPAEYEASHIPGARFLHLDEDLSAPKTGTNGRHPLPDPDVLMDKLGRTGVDSRKQVVAYDAQGGMVAARLWWLLRSLGHLPVAVLDGGWNQWIAEGRPQSSEVPRPQTTRPGRMTTRALVARRLGRAERALRAGAATRRNCAAGSAAG